MRRLATLLAAALAAALLTAPASAAPRVLSSTPAADAAPLTLSAGASCEYPADPYQGRPWFLQRVQLDQLWAQSKGEGVRVAVIDTGVDADHPQLADAVDVGSGADLIPKDKRREREPTGPTADLVGHGTKVAGIIAARPADNTGFVGIAPEATIIPIRQNNDQGAGDTTTLAQAIRHAIDEGADVINISQDTTQPLAADHPLKAAIDQALAQEIVVVASAGNDGADGKVKNTYPASFPGVLAVAASDRNNERALFSQRGEFVGIAAPGVDLVSTVPGGGHCADNGTSFAAPFVAGVAALLRAEHPEWKQHQIVAQIQQTAERAISGRDRHVGWGVVDPVRALTQDDRPIDEPVAREGVEQAPVPEPAPLQLGESYAERNERLGTYVFLTGAVLVTSVAGTTVVLRDRRRRTAAVASPDREHPAPTSPYSP
ncbi:type VII secretion-associated serine protease mycosin [Streptomyces sp. JJ66]|uniref:type VII secretion-associated serine protease mycosin n=1 Tax=Streptomyces sp. JJ66 TaxID=2803843 RepID=UPI001C58E480|nr:type VII secretion-associated serine protease mycosin [Streptomyces sp. JJ66]MBW1601210.1 type VII secretion-associated serine protease mycosin [Streptomyces sp. JJ66]